MWPTTANIANVVDNFGKLISGDTPLDFAFYLVHVLNKNLFELII